MQNFARVEIRYERLDFYSRLSAAKELRETLLDVWSRCSYWPGPHVRPFHSSIPVPAIQLSSSHLYNQRVKRSMGRQSAQVLRKAHWFSLGWLTTHDWHVVHSEPLKLQSSVTYLQGLPTVTFAETNKKKRREKSGAQKGRALRNILEGLMAGAGLLIAKSVSGSAGKAALIRP